MTWITRLLLMMVLMLPTAMPAVELAEANKMHEEAHLAFERGAFRDAMRLYEQVALAGFEPERVWTNAGTAAHRAGERGRAVLYYSRALKVDPEHSPASRSLAIVSPPSNAASEDAAANAVRNFMAAIPMLPVVVAGQLFFLLVCLGLWRAMASADPERRGHWLAVMGWSFAFLVLVAATGAYCHVARTVEDRVVVLDDGAVTYNEPRKTSLKELELPSGTILYVTDEPRSGFLPIRTADGRTGFIHADEVEQI